MRHYDIMSRYVRHWVVYVVFGVSIIILYKVTKCKNPNIETKRGLGIEVYGHHLYQ